MGRIRCGSIVCATVVAIVGFGRLAGAAVEYSLTIIAPGGALSINDAGEVTGEAGTGTSEAFVYQNGVLTVFGTQAGSITEGFGINASGVAVGTANAPGPNTYAFARQANGTITFPPLLSANAINVSGVIAGTVTSGLRQDAATYNGSSVTDLGTLGGNGSIAFGINNAGLVVGRSRDAAGVDHAVYWNHGVVTTLSNVASVASGVNSSGQVVGNNYFSGVGSDSIMHATVWQPDGTATDLTPGTVITSTTANAINDAGVIVGSDGFAAIWQNGVEQNLNDLIAPVPGLTLTEAFDINNSGQIVGEARTSGAVDEAFLLNPIPEPSMAIGAVGCAILLGARRGDVWRTTPFSSSAIL